MRTGSPFIGSSMKGREPSGCRSESVDIVRCIAGRRVGEEGRIPVDDVGMGVG